MQVKSVTIEKMDDAGTGLARIAILSEVDNDGDTYQPGAFSWKEGGYQWVQILPAHDRRAMPLGKARVYEEGNFVYAELSLNLETQAGRDWHSALKFDLANGNPVQEWSYGFAVLDASWEERAGDRVRLLKKLDVHEVSPVLKGAGVGTGTMSIKGAALKEDGFVTLIGELGVMADALAANPTMLSATGAKQLGDIHAALSKALDAIKPEEPERQEKAGDDTVLANFLQTTSLKHLRGRSAA